MERVKRVVSLVLCFVMVFGLLPMSTFAVSADDTLTAALTEAESYTNAITVNNSSNDPATVVKNFKTHFTWDNEKREGSKSYLFDWSYYNGVVFEGIEYLYEVTGNTTYKDYVVEYMSSLIASNGTWATCSNDSSKQCAGYNSTHGADCYKTASLLLDAYEMTGDSRYLTVAKTLYADLDTAAANSTYNLSNCGNNYRHTWASNPDPDLWLDGLYMILPFRAEYAKHIGDQEELDLIVKRLQWVSDNMYNSSNGLFYHAADSATSNSGNYWLRAMGWYAAAMVDVMDSMEGDNLETMKKQLVKFVDGMKKNQNTSNGMWKNNVLSSETAKNPYETSGTALTCYAVMKAVNNGWLDESYADMAILAFKGICNEKLDGNTLKDICFKGTPGSGNETFYDNEGKGVGPFIMFYAEVLEYVNSQEEEPEVTEPEVTEPEVTEPEVTEPEVTEPVITHISVEGTTAYAVGDDLTFTTLKAFYEGGSIDLMDENGYPVDEVVITGDYDMNAVGSYSVVVSYAGFDRTYYFTVSQPESLYNDSESGVSISGNGVGITNVSASVNTEAEGVVAKAIGADGSVTFSLSGTFLSSGFKAEVTLPVDESWENVAVYHVDGDKYTKYDDVDSDPTTYTFVTGHFSDWEQTYDLKAAAETGWVTYEGANYYEKVTSMQAGTPYVITRTSSTYYALTRDSSGVTRTSVTISQNSDGTYNIANVSDSMTWYIDASGHIYCTVNGINYYLNASTSGVSISTTASTVWSVNGSGNNVTIRTSIRSGGRNYTYYLRYSSGSFSVSTSTSNNTLSLYAKRAQAGGQARLNGELEQTVSVGDGTTQGEILNKVTVEWDSDLDGVADSTIALSECDVTGAYVNATAGDYTLTVAYNEKTLGTVTVHVVAKTVVDKALFGNSDRVVRLNGVVDYSDIYLVLTYDDDSEVTIPYNQLIFGSVDTSKVGENEVGIFYNGERVGTVNVTVSDNPYEGLDTATEYPVYPAPGSVRMTKTAKEMDFENTGTVQIELTAAGISLKNGVDVILVTDLSNSMAWKLGTRDNASTHEETKLATLQTSVKSFADIFLANSADGSPTQNTVSLVTFGGFDKEHTKTGYTGSYADVTQTLLLGSNSASTVTTAINNIRLLANSSYSGGYRLSFDGGTTYSGNYGNTNYDYAFMQAAEAITDLKAKYLADNNVAYDDSGRQIYVLFMTDGAPSNYNGVYYRGDVSGTSRPDVQATWVNEAGNTVQYTMGTGSGTFTNANWQNYLLETDLLWAEKVLDITSVVDIFNIGFDLTQGGFKYNEVVWTFDRLDEVLAGMVPGKTLFVEPADDDEALEKIYKDLATKIRNAGTDAQVTDIIQEEFTLQLNAFGKKNSSGVIENPTSSEIEVRAYELWLPSETDNMNLIGTRKRYNGDTLLTDPTAAGYTDGTYHYTTLEKVTFTYNADGSVSGAYSTAVDEGKTNIYSESGDTYTIDAKYFTFHKDENAVETFKWKIGDITDDEIALSYFAYLENSMGEDNIGVGERFYYTNEQAYLEYIDINGDYVNREYVRPQVYWGGASTAYEFYLVNAAGKPCNYDGEEIPFANRIVIVDPEYDYLNLNIGENYYSREIIASKVLPAGYKLYDETASYEVITASGDMTGSITISTPAEGKEQTTIVVSATTPSYIQSHVAFGVYYNVLPSNDDIILTPDRVVIDYGKVMHIDVSNGKTSEFDGNNKEYSVELVGFSKYFADVDLTKRYSETSYLAEYAYDEGFGTFRVVDGEKRIVSYTPDKLLEGVETVFCVLKLTEVGHDTNTFFMVEPLTVIPATVMYYETDFADGVFTYSNDWSAEKTDADMGFSTSGRDGNHQDAGVVGSANHVYGFDSTYNDDAGLSDGTSKFALGAGVDATTVTFSFTGTGFDLISRTGTEQGMIRVQVFSDSAMTKLVKTVSVLNKSESSLEIYQIPVVSINDLTYDTYYVKIGVDVEFETNKVGFEALNRGNEFYFDAIRIYDPVKGDSVAETAYNDDGEADEKIVEVRSLLLKANAYENISEATPGMLFVDRTQSGVAVTDYAAIGPNNETYLSNGQAIVFKFKAGNIPATFDIGVKTIKGDVPAGLRITFSDADGNVYWTVTKEITSSTVQFIDLFNATDGTVDKSKLFADDTYMVVTNSGEGVLSITDIKTAYSVNTAEVLGTESKNGNNTTVNGSTYNPFAVSYSVDAQTFSVAESVLLAQDGTTVEPERPEVDAAALKIVKASAKKDNNSKYTVSVVTYQEVKDVLVMQGSVELEPDEISYVDNADGTRTWTIVVSNGVSSRYGFFTLTGVGEGNVQGAAFNVAKSR